MVEASRSVLNRYIPDIYLHSDVYKGQDSGNSPGYGLSLVGETTEGALFCSEALSTPRADPHLQNRKKDVIFGEERDDRPPPSTPEEVALRASRALLVEMKKGGCVDRKHQWIVLLYMVLGSEDVGRVKTGPLSPRTYACIAYYLMSTNLTLLSSIQFLRDVKETFGTSFKIVPAVEGEPQGELLLSCYGTGFINVNRTVS